ncbi:MAG: phosphoribosyltransferase [Actinomycetes bacterium]
MTDRPRPERGPRFRDRAHAGEVLAAELAARPPVADRVVLGLPRGGVPVAAPVAARLAVPLGVLLVRKLGVPGRPELAMGAVALVGDTVELVRNPEVLRRAGVSPEAFDAVRAAEERALRDRAGRIASAPVQIADREVVVVDDGLATGATMTVAVQAARAAGARAVVAAAPVGAREAVAALARLADEVVCPYVPERFWAVGEHFGDFTQTSDAEVIALLTRRTDPGTRVGG